MGEKVEMLKNHSHFNPNLLDIFYVLGQLYFIHHDLAALMLLQAVNTADERGFARSRRTTDNNSLPSFYRQVHVLEDMEIAKPFVQSIDFNDHIRSRGN